MTRYSNWWPISRIWGHLQPPQGRHVTVGNKTDESQSGPLSLTHCRQSESSGDLGVTISKCSWQTSFMSWRRYSTSRLPGSSHEPEANQSQVAALASPLASDKPPSCSREVIQSVSRLLTSCHEAESIQTESSGDLGVTIIKCSWQTFMSWSYSIWQPTAGLMSRGWI